MKRPERVRIFDKWAEHYDSSVPGRDAFPFDGYEEVLDQVAATADARPGMAVLDLGIGTGNLAARLVAQGCTVWGIDFSPEMLKRARDKLAEVVLVKGDLLGDWPAELDRTFDRIVSTYVFHEFDLESKVQLLQKLVCSYLDSGARIVVGDIAYPTVRARDEATRHFDMSDDEEFYWAADEAAEACSNVGLEVSYVQISSCGGVFEIGPMR
jgi:putative AdoMet-dependent methyltransferase